MEKLMQYVWRFRLWPEVIMTMADGRRVDIIDPGVLNGGSGPDFFNAKVRIDGETWAGNIEIHVRASDWYRHGHDNDPAYDNVILHVVQYDDVPVTRRTDGKVIPQVTMTCAPDFSARYNAMVNNPATELPCADEIKSLPSILLTDWLTALATERLQRKADDIHQLLRTCCGNWNEVIYITLARGLGFGINADAMEQTARLMPLYDLLHNSDDEVALEAMLLGTAGLLEPAHPRDDYERALIREYDFYKKKYHLDPATVPQWGARLRPHNHPSRRLAQLASAIYGGFCLPGRILSLTSKEQAFTLFDIHVSEYWHRHQMLGSPEMNLASGLGKNAANLLLINVAVPVMYAYGESISDYSRRELAVDIMEGLPPEVNFITRIFTDAGLKCRDAFESQAFIQLRRNYCQTRKCLYCRLGHKLLSHKVKP